MNWRLGKLRVGAPRSYAAVASPEKLFLEFPLVFQNTGPRTIVVDNLRVLLPEHGGDAEPLKFQATVEKLATSEGRAFATQFPVAGGNAVFRICEFQLREPKLQQFEEKDYLLELQGALNGKTRWQTLCTFKLNVTDRGLATINHGTLTAHENWIDA